MLDATDAFIAKRPGFPIKIGIYQGKILAEAPGVGEREPVKR
jgi:hypothetical protein